MTQDEKWLNNYTEVVRYMEANHRNPSKHRAEDRLMVNWMKHQRKLMNKGELRPDRLARFKRLMAKAEKLKRVNQWEEIVEEIVKNDVLRSYQQEMIDKLLEAWTQYRSVMVQMPTGTGKTVLMSDVIRRQINDGTQGVLIVAHRRELLDQIRRTVEFFGIDMKKHHIIVESIQKLSRGNGIADFAPSLVIIDEAHHALAKTYRMLWRWWPQAKFLGLTATPCRMTNAGFLDLFQTLIQSHTIKEFIDMGWLSDFEYVTAEANNPILRQVNRLKKRGLDGDYQLREMAMVLDCEESIDNLYQAYCKYVEGKKGIVYAIDCEHARHITEYYQEQGINCCWIDANTPTKERDKLVQDYRDDLIDVVVNVDILGEGADFPDVEFIQLARPTLSLSKYLQQVGRGMRIAEGKDKVVILDHVGMYQSFGLPTEDWNWQLMFTGQLAGVAGIGRKSLLYVRGDGTEKWLMDTHMVPIKRQDEEHRGLEIFMQNGLYGITKDGHIIHQPLFQHVKRADDGYFAYCTYPYLVYHSRVIIIDKEGKDIGVKMYGNPEWIDNNILKGQDLNDNPLYWDRRYNAYYHEKPAFTMVAGIEMVKLKDGYVLRKHPSLFKPTKKIDIYYNRGIVWIRDWLIKKRKDADQGNYSPERILSYGYKFFYTRCEFTESGDIGVYSTAGERVGTCWRVPENDDHRRPFWRYIPLTNAQTGREGFPNQ